MSNVGPQAVSMRDLMKMGPQALGAMAQGQTPSIAPSYMVIAALKALTDQQKGLTAPEQPATVKDQLVAQATPPSQAGIGAMAPVQGFAGGGAVRELPPSFGEEVQTWLSGLGSGLGTDIDDLLRGRFRRRTLDEVNYGNEGRRTPYLGTQPTQAAAPAAVPVEQLLGSPLRTTDGENYSNEGRNAPSMTRAAASSTARSGIGGMGRNVLEAYKDPTAELGEVRKMPKLEFPEDKFLDEAVERYKKPDEARMKELRDAEESAGLAAFAKQIMQGQGFGAAFGPAAAAYVESKEGKAEKRRAYEDEREKIALELGLKKGTREFDKFIKGTEFQQQERNAQYNAARDSDEATFKRTEARNREILAAQEMAIRSEANKIANEVRRDGLDARRFERLRTLQVQAREAAQARAATYAKENPLLMTDTQRDAKLEFIIESEYRKLFPKELETVLYSDLGVSSETAAPAAGKQYRGVMK